MFNIQDLTLQEIMSKNRFFIYSFTLASRLSAVENIVFINFCNKNGRFNDEEFYYTVKDIINDTKLGDKAIRSAIKGLVQKGLLIDKGRRNMPVKQYFSINKKLVYDYVMQDLESFKNQENTNLPKKGKKTSQCEQNSNINLPTKGTPIYLQKANIINKEIINNKDINKIKKEKVKKEKKHDINKEQATQQVKELPVKSDDIANSVQTSTPIKNDEQVAKPNNEAFLFKMLKRMRLEAQKLYMSTVKARTEKEQRECILKAKALEKNAQTLEDMYKSGKEIKLTNSNNELIVIKKDLTQVEEKQPTATQVNNHINTIEQKNNVEVKESNNTVDNTPAITFEALTSKMLEEKAITSHQIKKLEKVGLKKYEHLAFFEELLLFGLNRIQIKHDLTTLGLARIVKTVSELPDPRASLLQSIERGYRGVFPVKENSSNSKSYKDIALKDPEGFQREEYLKAFYAREQEEMPF